MDQDATWYRGRSRPRPRCVRWRLSSPRKGHSSPSPFLARVYCSQTVAHLSYCWALVMTYYVRVISLWLTKIRNRSIELLLSFWQYVPVWGPSLSKFENLLGWQAILLQRRTEEHCLYKHNIDFCFLEGRHVCSCMINMKSVHGPIVVHNEMDALNVLFPRTVEHPSYSH